MKQKYHRGDRVLLKKTFPPSMSHFTFKGQEVIIQYSYGDRYGKPNSGGGYSVLGKTSLGWTSSAWYDDEQIKKLVSSQSKKDMKLLAEYGR